MGRAIAVQKVTEWMCHQCGYDMGEMFIECSTEFDIKVGFLTCPDCESTFIPSEQTNHPNFSKEASSTRTRRDSILIVEHEATAYCTTEITLPDGLTAEDVDEWELHDDYVKVYFDRGDQDEPSSYHFDLNHRDDDYTISDINRTTVRDPDYNTEYWRSDY